MLCLKDLLYSDGILAKPFRKWERQALLPILRLARRVGITPTAVTLSGMLLAIPTALAVSVKHLTIGAIFWLLNGILDIIDGELARFDNCTSARGGLLDSVADHVGDAVFSVGVLIMFLRQQEYGVVILVFLSLFTSFLAAHIRSRASMLGLRSDVGITTRGERNLILVVGLFLNRLILALVLVVAFNCITAVQRLVVAWHTKAPLAKEDRSVPNC